MGKKRRLRRELIGLDARMRSTLFDLRMTEKRLRDEIRELRAYACARINRIDNQISRVVGPQELQRRSERAESFKKDNEGTVDPGLFSPPFPVGDFSPDPTRPPDFSSDCPSTSEAKKYSG